MKVKNIRNNLIALTIFSKLLFPFAIFAEDTKQDTISSNYKSLLNPNYLKKIPQNEYLLGIGDILFIRISRNHPELDSKVRVDGDGTIYLPRLAKVYVKGLTTDELNILLSKAFEEFIIFPSVETQIAEYRDIKVSVLGEVNRPGIKNLKGYLEIQNNSNKGLSTLNNFQTFGVSQEFSERGFFNLEKNISFFPTIFDAIRSAGGITEYSDLSNVELIRKDTQSNGGGLKKTNLNFYAVLNEGETSQNIRILDGDILKISKSDSPNYQKLNNAVRNTVNPEFISVFVSGRVKNPGKITIPVTSSLNDAILVVGGPKVLKGKLKFVRFNNNGNIDSRKLSYNPRSKRGSYKNPVLKNNDLIFIDDSFFTASSEVITEFTRPFFGLFSFYGLLKAIDD